MNANKPSKREIEALLKKDDEHMCWCIASETKEAAGMGEIHSPGDGSPGDGNHTPPNVFEKIRAVEARLNRQAIAGQKPHTSDS